MAAAPPVLITGRGAVGPTGVAMPPITDAGACIGTRLPATSDCVEIGWVVVFASLTKSVNRSSPFIRHQTPLSRPSHRSAEREPAPNQIRGRDRVSERASPGPDPGVSG